jgi:pilus assembly protein CpaB
MKSRSLVVAGALLLALLATAGVFLYVNNVRQAAETGGSLTAVLVPAADIPAGTELNPLIDNGAFVQIDVPTDALVQGAVTDVAELRDRTASVPILRGEQIALSRLSGTAEELPGGVFGQQEGFQAVTVKLEAEQFIGDELQVGDRVTTYAHFSDIQVASASLASLFGKGGKDTGQTGGSLPDVTAVIIPETRVLQVTGAPATEEEVSSGDQVTDNQLVTLELLPEDAERLVYSQNVGRVWLALIRPGDKVPSIGPVTLSEVVGR